MLLWCSETWPARRAWTCSQCPWWTGSWTCECTAAFASVVTAVSAHEQCSLLAATPAVLPRHSCTGTCLVCKAKKTLHRMCLTVCTLPYLLLHCRSVLREIVGDNEYFLGILPDGTGLASAFQFGVKAPIQMGRQVLAQLAGVPER